MRRLPLVLSFLLFLLLCASIAYWGMDLFKPPLRPVAAPPRAAQSAVDPEAASALFGGRANMAAASNYDLKGVIFSGNPHNSVAILSVDGKPAEAVRAQTEFLPGVTVKEVHRNYVLLTEGGATKRVDLPENAPVELGVAATSPVATERPPVQRTPTPMPTSPAGTPTRAQTAAAGGVPQPITPPGSNTGLTPQNAPSPAQPGTMPPPTVVVSPPPGGARTNQPGTVPPQPTPPAGR